MGLPLLLDVGSRTIEVREFVPADEPAVADLFQASADWFETATGSLPSDGDVQSLFYSLPEGADPKGKRVLVVVEGSHEFEVVGLVEAVVGHPGPTGCAVGLFLIRTDRRRQGLGAAVANALLEQAADDGVAVVTATNTLGWTPGEAFLRSMGFELSEQELERGDVVGNRSVGPRERPVIGARLSLHPQ
ncbi:MAG: GNAT family N-acetyltransferase [Actinomycetota bacterium]|nr:GNAT family N-acetyltransferase [Actinomycetota bacterium]